MAQLVIRYKSGHPELREVTTQVQLPLEDEKGLDSPAIHEIVIDGEVFVPRGQADREDGVIRDQ